MRFNTATQQSGHVWQGRFYSCPLDESHLWAAVRYVERNPVRAGLVGDAADFPWSSAPAHCGNAADGVLSKEFPPPAALLSRRRHPKSYLSPLASKLVSPTHVFLVN